MLSRDMTYSCFCKQRSLLSAGFRYAALPAAGSAPNAAPSFNERAICDEWVQADRLQMLQMWGAALLIVFFNWALTQILSLVTSEGLAKGSF